MPVISVVFCKNSGNSIGTFRYRALRLFVSSCANLGSLVKCSMIILEPLCSFIHAVWLYEKLLVLLQSTFQLFEYWHMQCLDLHDKLIKELPRPSTVQIRTVFEHFRQIWTQERKLEFWNLGGGGGGVLECQNPKCQDLPKFQLPRSA